MDNKKEIKGIYNTTFNQKKATPISLQSDIEIIENAIIEEVVMYVKGYHKRRNDRGFGAEHIKIHLEENSQGYIKLEELLNLGKSIRDYNNLFKKPFIDEKGGKVYEWENEKEVRFRAITDTRREGDNCHSTSPSEIIITFYSDRNLNKKMEFKNPIVEHFYANEKKIQSIEKILHSNTSISQKEKALQELEGLTKQTHNKEQRQNIQKLCDLYLKQGVKKWK